MPAIHTAVDGGTRVQAAAAQIAEEQGKLDVLIVNGDFPGGRTCPTQQSIDKIRRFYEVNVFGTVRLIQTLYAIDENSRLRDNLHR